MSFNNAFTHSSWGIALRYAHNDFSETDIFGRTDAFNGIIETSAHPSTPDFQIDRENFIAKADVEAVLYCHAGNERIILDNKPFTVAYDKKPGTALHQCGIGTRLLPTGDQTEMEDAIRSEQIISGAFWFESDIKFMEENGNQSKEMGSLYRQDFREPGIETDFYRHYATYNFKTKKDI